MRIAVVAALALVAVVPGAARGAMSTPALAGRALGGVPFGLPRTQVVARLTARFGQPSRRFVNDGCGPRYTEVAWRHLYVEFRLGRFSGFRYIEGGWPPTRFGGRRIPSDLPRLATSRGVTLGSTLAGLRAAYGHLTVVGTDRRRSNDGLVFYDDAEHDPAPPSSRIVEIKAGTCGDF